jgi:hypothetical protein
LDAPLRPLSGESRRLALLVLFAAVLIVIGGTQKRQITYNDGISYLAAAASQVRYEEEAPVGRWVPAAQWQELWQPGSFPAFGTIARDLAETDIHPPLYFWLLHLWGWLFGNGLALAPILNLLFLALATVVLYSTCRQARVSEWGALVATSAWTLSGSMVLVHLQARQYSLLALVAILFVRSYVAFVRGPSLANACVLLLLGAAGLLTHLHFALLIAAAGLHSLVRLRQTRVLVVQGLAALGSLALFVVAHPAILDGSRSLLTKREGWSRRLDVAEAVERFAKFAETVIELAMPIEAALAAAVAGAVWFAVSRLRRRASPERPRWVDSTAWVVGAMSIAFVGVLYVTGQSPGHAMRASYLAVGSAALFVGLGAAFDRLWAVLPVARRQQLARAAICAFALYGSASTARYVLDQRVAAGSYAATGGRVIVDVVKRGHLLPLLWHADPNTLVYAAARKSLLKSPPPGLGKPGPLMLFDTSIRARRNRQEQQSTFEMLRAAGREPRATGDRVFVSAKSGRPRVLAKVYVLE